jgi:hypothetical protein
MWCSSYRTICLGVLRVVASVALALAAPSPALAQGGTLSGTVVDESGGLALA